MGDGNCLAWAVSHHKVQDIDTWWGHWLGGVGLQHNSVTLI